MRMDKDESGLLRTVAAVIADARGRVLLVRKRGSRFFIQPGGKCEPDEAALETLARELREELDVELAVDDAVFLGEFEASAVNEPGRRVRAQAFAVSVRGDPSPQAEIEAMAWVHPDELHTMTVAPLSADFILPAWRSVRAQAAQ